MPKRIPTPAKSKSKATPAARPRPKAAPAVPAPAEAEPEAQLENSLPIVGIGASAGGYEAFVQLLQALPADTGMAFVLVMHLEPEHKSMLARLLGNLTQMPVSEAKHGMEVQANNVYVIPQKADMGIVNGVLQITSRRQTGGRYLPVDYFFSSLAEDRRGRAIGVVLSGTGSDGTLGLKSIKAEGGITFAQDELTAKHFGMPGSAIAAECVDFILPPPQIAAELRRLAHHPYVGLAPSATPASPVPLAGESDFRKILHLMRFSTGVDFLSYKPGTIRRRIVRRMALLRIEGMDKYLEYLQAHRPEAEALFQDILINVTSFFREPEAFKALQAHIFPRIKASKRPGDAIRIWVPGCSTGEEVYSLAIALIESLEENANTTPIQIFGTDISDAAIDKARSGFYTDSSLHDVSQARLRRFFSKGDGGYRVNKTLRDMCVFARQDLSKDPPFSRMDLISCRNVLIYMGQALQRRIVTGFHYALRDTGFLLLGKSEAPVVFSDMFTTAEHKVRVFFKKSKPGPILPEYVPTPLERTTTIHAPLEPAFDLLKEADRLVWKRFSHAGVVLNDNLEILHFRGDTGAFIAPASGKATLNVLRMVRDELKTELRSAIYNARRSGQAFRAAGVRVRVNGHTREIEVEVQPFSQPGGNRDRYFLVLFNQSHQEGAPAPAEEPAEAHQRRASSIQEIDQLRRELEALREYAQSVVEQQEASNEELKSANEEILSSNEELQSTNEELQTAKEELQSTNEELVTLNDTLQSRNVELGRLSDDLKNVLEGLDIPILIVGADGRIRRFTPSAGLFFSLLPSDVGRPITDIRAKAADLDFADLLTRNWQSLTDIQQDIQSLDGRWYTLRARPYKTVENRVDGVLLALVDINELKRANQTLREAESLVGGLLATHLRAILTVDTDGKIVMTNPGVDAIFGYKHNELIGQQMEILLPERLRAEHVERRARFLKDPQNDLFVTGPEMFGCRKNGSEFPIELNLSYAQMGDKLLGVANIEDLSEERTTKLALAENEAALRASRQQLQTLTASLLTAQEEERERLAAELHDDLGQRMTGLALMTAQLEKHLRDGNSTAGKEARSLREMIEQLSDDLRVMAHELHPSILKHFGLAKALRSYCADFSRMKGFNVQWRQRHLPESIPDDVALCFYRVVQATLSNAARHSGAGGASVLLGGIGDRIHLVIKDEGVGFDPEAIGEKPGLGLLNIRERVRLVGGTLAINSEPGKGARIEVSAPLDGKLES